LKKNAHDVPDDSSNIPLPTPQLSATVAVSRHVRNTHEATDGKLKFELAASGTRNGVFEGYLARGDAVISGLQTLIVTKGCIVRAGGTDRLLIVRQPQRQKSCSPKSASTAERAVPGQDWPQGNLYNDRRTHLNRRAKAGGVWPLRRRGTRAHVFAACSAELSPSTFAGIHVAANSTGVVARR
jgi:hypothetical protein